MHSFYSAQEYILFEMRPYSLSATIDVLKEVETNDQIGSFWPGQSGSKRCWRLPPSVYAQVLALAQTAIVLSCVV